MRSTAIIHITRGTCPRTGCGIGRLAVAGHATYTATCADCGQARTSHIRAELDDLGGWVRTHRGTCPNRPGVTP